MSPAFAHSHLQRLRSTVAQRLGLRYDGRLDHLADVLRRGLEATASPSCDAYLERLSSSAHDAEEVRWLAEQLTVTETFFFRNSDHFRALSEVVLPARIQARAPAKRLRILSAGCASGEEPYSVAMLLKEQVPDLEAWSLDILGIDVNRAMLAKARRARYSDWSLRATSRGRLERHFRKEGRHSSLAPAIRAMVRFEEHNLAGGGRSGASGWDRSEGWDVILCRNVMMYFTPEVLESVLARLTRALLPGGFLFIGHAETLRGLSLDYHLRHTHGTFYYQKLDRAEAPGPIEAPFQGERWRSTPRAEASDWVEAIQRSSDRIAWLARLEGCAPEPSPEGGERPDEGARELEPILEAVRAERYSEALELLGGLPAQTAGEPPSLLLRAVLQANGGLLREAEETCARLLDRDRSNAGAHYVMALCREQAGDPTSAICHDQSAIQLDESFAMPHLHLGLLARRASDVLAARRALGQALFLLEREDANRILLFGGGFTREALLRLCRSELQAAGGLA